MSLPPALLISTTRPSLPAVRALGLRGVSVWAATQEPGIASRSRHLKGFFATPHPLTSTAQFIERLLEVSASFCTTPVLLPCDDVTVGVAAAAAGELNRRYRLAVTDPDRVVRLLDKAVQVELVAGAGVRVPRTWTPADALEARRIAREARFPVVVKPRTAQQFLVSHGVKALQVQDLVELTAVLDRFAAMMVQEIVPGPVESLYEHNSFVDRQGIVRVSSVARKRDEDPKPFGSATAIELVEAPEVDAAGLEVVRALGFRGSSHSEFKLDGSGGAPVFIEFNPRFAWSAAVQTAGGVDTIFPTYAEAAGLPLSLTEPRRERTVWFTPERITKGRALRPPRALEDSRPGRARLVTDVLDPDDFTDLGPLVSEVGQAARLRLRRVARQLPHALPLTVGADVGRRMLPERIPRLARAWRIVGVTADGRDASILCLAPRPGLAQRLLDAVFPGAFDVGKRGWCLVGCDGPSFREDLVVAWAPASPEAWLRAGGWLRFWANPHRVLDARNLDALAADVAVVGPVTEAADAWLVEAIPAARRWDAFCRTMLRPSFPGGLREAPPSTPYLRKAASAADLYLSVESGTPVAGILALREGPLVRLLAGGVLHGSQRLRSRGALWAAVRHCLHEAAVGACTEIVDETAEHAQRHPELHVHHQALLLVRSASKIGEDVLGGLSATEEERRAPVPARQHHESAQSHTCGVVALPSDVVTAKPPV